jgi:hypothetical protein
MVGDIANQTDNVACRQPGVGTCDDRLVFTEVNPARALVAAANAAAAARVLRGFDDALAADGLRAAEAVWRAEEPAARAAGAGEKEVAARVHAAVELFLTTRKEEYRRAVLEAAPVIKKQIAALGWVVGRALPAINDAAFTAAVRDAVAAYAKEERAAAAKNPFAVPYEPVIWGAGWGIQEHGVRMYFLHAAFPDLVAPDGALDALNFILGVHPGANTASFASGVGARSMTTAYGWNRADWSYIPGGVVSGTALIRPDFPELKDFPFLWQQGEYVLGGGATNFMFLALAAERIGEAAGARNREVAR